MTIAAAYLTSEGVVLGSDSATVVQVVTADGHRGVTQVFSYAQKVFEVGENGRLGVCTWGSGAVGSTSHRTLIARLGDSVEKDGLSTEAAADMLLALLKRERDEQGPAVGAVGYFVGGWDLETHRPACYHLFLDLAGDSSKAALQIGQAQFSGVPKFFTRVFHGYDPELKSKLCENLKKRLGASAPPEFDSLFQQAFEESAVPLVAAGFRDLPLREAIDFIYSYVHITVKAVKFMFGPPTCGGPIEVGFISSDRRFRWVRHKGFDAAIGGM